MTLVIAEAGVNHNGDERLATEMIDQAKDCGADVVKFQSFKANQLATPIAKLADYQVTNGARQGSQQEMLKELELGFDAQERLAKYCSKRDIEFLSTAFDFESLNFLARDLKLSRLKIGSGELTNAPFLLSHALTGCDLILSTGMATLGEIERALGVLAYGFTNSSTTTPSMVNFEKAYASDIGQASLREKVTILHCTSDYPAPVDEVNLLAMNGMREAFGLPVGYSDHTSGIAISVAAVALGAVCVEKHFTLNQKQAGPDHAASLEPRQLKEMVQSIRDVERAVGNGIKRVMPSEISNRSVARKSLVAVKHINKGDLFSSDNVSVMRPGVGLDPFAYWDLMGKVAGKEFTQGEIIEV